MKFFSTLFARFFTMMRNGVYFIVIALLVAELIKICISYQFFELGKSNPVARCKREFFPFFKQVKGRVKPLLCGLLGTELSGLDNREPEQSKI